MSYVKFKVKAGSGGVVLGAMICLNFKNGELEASLTSSIIGRIRSPSARPSVSELCKIQG